MKQNILYIFNPEHDLALANGDAHFNAPVSTKEFSRDAVCLTAWMAKEGSVLSSASFSESENTLFQQLGMSVFPMMKDEIKNVKWDTVIPWGWDAAVCEFLRKSGIDVDLLPNSAALQNIRELSHRKVAVEALGNIIEHATIAHRFPQPAKFCSSITEIEIFLTENQSIVLKSPWSGSGKGLRWCNGKLSKSDEGWCRHIIQKQGGVMAEKHHKVVQDFAMEFICEDKVSLAGYSLFQTENGIYRGNVLASDAVLEQRLNAWLTNEEMQEICYLLIDFLSHKLIGKYRGYLGVDMFIYEEDQLFKIHPAVEINLRMTMGMLARIIYDHHLAKDSIGQLQMDFSPQKGSLLKNHIQKQQKSPLQIKNQRIQKGYISLCPINEQTKYAVSMLIQ